MHANRWMRGLNSTTQPSMPPVPVRKLHFSVLTPMLAHCSTVLALTHTTQVRSSGSQVYVGNRNHRAEPLPVLRRAPMNPSSDVLQSPDREPASLDPTRVLTEGQSLTFCLCSLSCSETQEVDEEEEGQTPKLKSGPNVAKDDDSFSDNLLFLRPCCKNVPAIFES